MNKNLVIILAGGTGSRVAGELPKQLLELKGKTILAHTVERFEFHPDIHHIFIVSNAGFLEQTREIIREAGYKKVVKILQGGEQRQDSSRIGVNAAETDEYENVLIHDAARPFIGRDLVDRILEALKTHDAINVAIPSSDTVIRIDETHFIRDVLDRRFLRRVQTPQAFKMKLIREAHRLAPKAALTNATDDCSLVLNQDLSRVFVVEGSSLNIKITYPIDLLLAEKILDSMDFD